MLAKMFEVAVLSRSITIKYEVGPAKMRRLMSLYTGWWLSHPSEKYEFVSWGYYSQYMESHKSHVPNHQPV